MSTPSDTNAESQLRQTANTIIEWVFLQLVKEIRTLGMSQTPRALPPKTQSALIQAELGAVLEVRSNLEGVEWAEDWEANAKAWALQIVLGENDLERARVELERAASSDRNDLSQFTLCGILAARHLSQSLNEGVPREQWLEAYEGTFGAMARLFENAA